MSSHNNGPTYSSAEEDLDTAPCRRRPDRLAEVHPSLIPLLRGSVKLDAVDPGSLLPEDLETGDDNLAAARGIMLAIVLSAPVWALLIRGTYLLLH